MEFHGMESIIMDLLRTPELQRLKKIRQLGLAHLVFPGAEHSRFAHSLGASFLSLKFAKQIKERASHQFTPDLCPDEASVRDMGVAALCHDLGHGPLSHAWEREVVGDLFDRKAWAKSLGLEENDLPSDPKWHELVGHSLLLWPDGHLHRLLEQQEVGLSRRIHELLSGKYYIPYLPRLLSSDIDADRADFIRRDTHHTGVKYGRYDLSWLISTSTLGRISSGGKSDWVVGFDARKGVRVVEQFLIARRAMYETVYHHKTVRSAEGMIALFLRRLKTVVADGTKFEVADFVKPMVQIIKGEAIGPEELLKLDDFTLSVLIDQISLSKIPDRTVTDLALRLSSRDLFKFVPVSTSKINDYLLKQHAIEKLHEAIEPYSPGLSEYYLVLDRTEFNMLSNRDEQKVCMIDSQKNAVYANDHENLRSHQTDYKKEVRIFTIREAVDSVRKCIESS